MYTESATLLEELTEQEEHQAALDSQFNNSTTYVHIPRITVVQG